MDVCRQTITAKVSHQNWCKVSQQKSWSYVVRQSPQKFHTRTGAKYRSKSHSRMSSDHHRKSFTPELVQSFTAKVTVVRRETITVVVSYGRLSFNSNAGNNIFFRWKYVTVGDREYANFCRKIIENCTANFLLQSYQIFDFKSFNCNGTFFVLIYYTIKFNFFIWL